MNINIVHKTLILDMYGFSGVAINKNWAATGFKLMDKMWERVKAEHIRHKGRNIWVYGENDELFTGIEVEMVPESGTALEQKTVNLSQYAYCKHIGAYSKIGETGSKGLAELHARGLKTCLPYIEIYGHWTEDETKLETELFWCLEN